MTVHFSDGTGVSPEVDANFNCLQATGAFCQQAAPTKQEIARKLSNVSKLLQAVKTQSDALSSDEQAKVQPWIDQLVSLRRSLQLQLRDN